MIMGIYVCLFIYLFIHLFIYLYLFIYLALYLYKCRYAYDIRLCLFFFLKPPGDLTVGYAKSPLFIGEASYIIQRHGSFPIAILNMLNDHEGFLSEENVGHQDVFQESWAYYNQMTEACQRRMEVSMTWRTASLNAPGNGKIFFFYSWYRRFVQEKYLPRRLE